MGIFFSITTSAQYDGLMDGCGVSLGDVIISEHIMSIHSGRASPQVRQFLRDEVVRIKSEEIRRNNVQLGDAEVREQARQWLINQLEELENQDQDDLEEAF